MKPRNRWIKPEFFKHELLYELEKRSCLPIRLAYAGLWTCCDREGRFEWKPNVLKLDILPYDLVDFADVLALFERYGFVIRYSVAGRTYGVVVRFPAHQPVNSRETPSQLPPPPESAIRAWHASMLSGSFHVFEDAQQPCDLSTSFDLANPLNGENSDSEATASSENAPKTVASALGTNGVAGGKLPHNSQRAVESLLRAPVATRLNGKTLHDSSRVSDASSTSEAREGHDTSPDVLPDVLRTTGRTTEERRLDDGTLSDVTAIVLGSEGSQHALPAVRGPRNLAAIRQQLAQVLDEIATGTREKLSKEQARKLIAENVIIGYWMAKYNHPKALIDPKRTRIVMRCLEENGDNVSEILYALDGAAKDKYVNGEKDGQRHDEIEFLLRNRGSVEKFANLMKGYQLDKAHPTALKYSVILSNPAQSRDQARIAIAEGATIEPADHNGDEHE
jgi:hypothetical protein